MMRTNHVYLGLALMTSPFGSDPFIGRKREMADLVKALDDALEGRGRTVMLVGEPGIGKTRMAEALADIAAESGFTTLWGRCPEQRGAPPYRPWAQIVRSSIARFDADMVRHALGSNAGASQRSSQRLQQWSLIWKSPRR